MINGIKKCQKKDIESDVLRKWKNNKNQLTEDRNKNLKSRFNNYSKNNVSTHSPFMVYLL